MNKKVLVIALALAMLALPMSAVLAKNNLKFIDVAGTLTITPTAITVPKPAGESGNVVLVVTGNTATWSGGIDGVADASGHFLAHNAGTPDAYTTARNIHTFTNAEVDGKQGGLTIISVGSSLAHGQWRIVSGTGELAGIHGQGTWSTIALPFLYEYEGTVHFDP